MSIMFSFLILRPYLFFGIENARLIEALNVDEAYFLRYINAALEQKSFGIIMHNYGYLYFYLGLVPLMILDQFIVISDPVIVFFFRSLSTLFFIGSVLLLFKLGKYVFNTRIAYLASVLMLFVSSDLIFSATEFHPDMAQLFFVLACFYMLYRYYFESKINHLLWAAVWAGCAYSCKYSGLLLVPFVFGVFLLKKEKYPLMIKSFWWAILGYMVFLLLFVNPFNLQEYLNNNFLGNSIWGVLWLLFVVTIVYLPYRVILFVKQKSLSGNAFTAKLDMLYLLALCFWGAFVVSSPGAVYHYTFIDSFQKVIGFSHQGLSENVATPFTWLQQLVHPNVMGGWLVVICSFVGTAIIVFSRKKLVKLMLPIWLWILVFMLVVMFWVKLNYSYYLLPIIPFMLLMAAFCLESIAAYFNRLWNYTMTFSFIVVASGCIAFLGVRHKQVNQRFQIINEPRIQLSAWINENVDGVILSDYYVYIPPSIADVEFTWGISNAQLASLPQWIIVNQNIKDRWQNRPQSDQYLNYKLVESQKIFELVKQEGGISIYKRKT